MSRVILLPALLVTPLLAGCGGRSVLPAAKAEQVLARVREAHEAGTWSRVRSAAGPLLDAHPRTPGSEEALFLVADAEEHRGRPTAAYEAYETLAREHPASDRLRELSRREFAMAAARHEQGKPRLSGHFLHFGPPLSEVLEDCVRHDPYGEQAPYALLLAATCEYDAGRWEEAEDLLGRVLRDYPKSPWVPQATFLQAMSAFRQCKGASYDALPLRNAKERFLAFLSASPEGPDALAARRMLILIGDIWAERLVLDAEVYRKLDQPQAAALSLREAASRWPDSPWAEKARQELESGK